MSYKKSTYQLFFLIIYFSLSLGSSFCFITNAQEPLQISTETEDIALTDNLNIARAQVAKYPDNPETHFNLAIALSRTSKIEETIKELRKTKLLIRKKENLGTIDKKICEYKEMLKTNPDATNIIYRLAFSHYLKAYLISKEIEKAKPKQDKKDTQGLLQENLLALKKNLDINPAIKENLKQSVYYFKELLKINPSDVWGKVYYAFILAEQLGEVKEATDLWTEVSTQDPNNPAPHFFLGELHIKKGNLKEGIKEISKALLLRSLGY